MVLDEGVSALDDEPVIGHPITKSSQSCASIYVNSKSLRLCRRVIVCSYKIVSIFQ